MTDKIAEVKTELFTIIDNARKKVCGDETLPQFNIEIPADTSHGDFATNAALCSAKAMKQNPRKLAEDITKKLDLKGSFFSRFEIAGPGFINFFLDDRFYAETVSDIIGDGADYGKTDFGKNETRLVEFVSANPTGPMHIGNARGGALGDAIAEILKFAGYNVSREFYVNDAGQQVYKFGASLSKRYEQICSENGQALFTRLSDTIEKQEAGTRLSDAAEPNENDTRLSDNEKFAQSLYSDENNFPMPEGLYLGTDIIIHAKNYYDVHGNGLLKLPEEERMNTLSAYALPLNIDKLKSDLSRYGIEYDRWFLESSLAEEVPVILEKLKASGYTYELDGALWLKTAELGDEKDRVLVRANGVPTYVVPDIAYHYDKLVKRGFDKAVDVLGADHHGYIPRIKAAMKALGVDPERLDVVIMQMVMLVRDGQAVKLSKRSGKAITMETLLDEIPLDAARFLFNLREPDTHIELDLDLAVEQTSKNPVYYVEYAHARICSILKNLSESGFEPDQSGNLSFTVPEEKLLIRTIARLPEVIITAAKNYNPSEITGFCIELAGTFHKFYDKCRIKGEDEDTVKSRLTLCLATKITIANALKILGITAPERM
ncbi:MAG: arginine--tRNA ligase [Ruminococcus sp.]|jgi:arginyl-tRNA synthetase|nr:arginine--tRNA ligase [Ruminococcus sp.]